MGLVATAEMCLTSHGLLTTAHRLSLTRSGFFLENKPNLNYKMLCIIKSVEITRTLTGSRHGYSMYIFLKTSSHLRSPLQAGGFSRGCVRRCVPAVRPHDARGR